MIGLATALHRLSELSKYLSIATDFKRSGNDKFFLNLPTSQDANNFVKDFWDCRNFIFHNELWFASIPDFKVNKKVFLSGIDDAEVDTTLLKECMRPPTYWDSHWESPKDVIRLKRRVVNKDSGEISYEDTKAIIAIFSNIVLPPYVYVLGKRIYLNPFVQRVVMCDHCMRYGHHKGICRSSDKPKTCKNCGESGHEASSCVASKPKCINCFRYKFKHEFDHPADHGLCPALLQQKEARRLMAMECLSSGEAISRIRSGVTTGGDGGVVGAYPAPSLAEFMPAWSTLKSGESNGRRFRFSFNKDRNSGSKDGGGAEGFPALPPIGKKTPSFNTNKENVSFPPFSFHSPGKFKHKDKSKNNISYNDLNFQDKSKNNKFSSLSVLPNRDGTFSLGEDGKNKSQSSCDQMNTSKDKHVDQSPFIKSYKDTGTLFNKFINFYNSKNHRADLGGSGAPHTPSLPFSGNFVFDNSPVDSGSFPSLEYFFKVVIDFLNNAEKSGCK